MTSPEKFVEAVTTQGFALAGDGFSGKEIDVLIATLSEPSLRRSKAGIRHLMWHPDIQNVSRSSRLIDLARSILGPLAFPYRATLFDKSPDANWLVVWHQDTALPLQLRHDRPGWGPWSMKEGVLYAHASGNALRQVLALRLHLDASHNHNGPLRVLPATHSQDVLTDKAIEELVAKTPPIECTAPRGGILAMRPLLVHASSKSQSHEPRRVLHLEYAAAPEIEGLRLAVA